MVKSKGMPGLRSRDGAKGDGFVHPALQRIRRTTGVRLFVLALVFSVLAPPVSPQFRPALSLSRPYSDSIPVPEIPRPSVTPGEVRLFARPAGLVELLGDAQWTLLGPLVQKAHSSLSSRVRSRLCQRRREMVEGRSLLSESVPSCPSGGFYREKGGRLACTAHPLTAKDQRPARTAPPTDSAGDLIASLREIEALELSLQIGGRSSTARLEDLRLDARGSMLPPLLRALIETDTPGRPAAGVTAWDYRERSDPHERSTPDSTETRAGPSWGEGRTTTGEVRTTTSGSPLLILEAAADKNVTAVASERLSRLPVAWPVPLGVAFDLRTNGYRLALHFATAEQAGTTDRNLGLLFAAASLSGWVGPKKPEDDVISAWKNATRSVEGTDLVLSGSLTKDGLVSVIRLVLKAALAFSDRASSDRSSVSCDRSRRILGQAVCLWQQERGASLSKGFEALQAAGFIPSIPTCQANGAYVLTPDGDVGCTIHAPVSHAPVSNRLRDETAH